MPDLNFTQVGSKLVGVTAIGQSHQGSSVSLSSDASTLAVGGFTDNNQAGATWIFVKSFNQYIQQAELIGTGATNPSGQGSSVSLSASGDILAIGGATDNGGIGATWL